MKFNIQKHYCTLYSLNNIHVGAKLNGEQNYNQHHQNILQKGFWKKNKYETLYFAFSPVAKMQSLARPVLPSLARPKTSEMGPRPMCAHCASACSPHARSRSPVFSHASGPVAETGPRPSQAHGAPASQATTWAWAGHSSSA